MRCVHFVGFRGDNYQNAVRVFGAPHFVHRDYDARVFTEVADGDVVVFGSRYAYTDYVWDASGVNPQYTD